MTLRLRKCSAAKIEFARFEIGIIDLDSSIAYLAEPIKLVSLAGNDLKGESDKLIQYSRLAAELRRNGITIKYINSVFQPRDCYNVFSDL